MNPLLALPPALQTAVLGALGLVAGSFINAGIYALAWYSRPISPWQRRHEQAPSRGWPDFVPIVGWLGLAREAVLHGRGFWVRPLLIELACGIGLPALYGWETAGKLAPPLAGVVPPPAAMLFAQFISHAILIGLMLVATFIDYDEKTIPDEITIPGTLIGLALAALWPDSNLPVSRPLMPPPIVAPFMAYQPLLLTSTSVWPPWLNGERGLAIGLAIFVAWCVALIPALATLRRGWWKAVQFYFASVARESGWWKMLLLAALGSAAISAVWHRGGPAWTALLTALIGSGFGGGLIWSVRVGGRLALHKEAMGFGDVTLMAMIGAFLGWQPCLMIFFLSPFAALASAAITRRRDIPYGPYLCAAALAVILKWPWFWKSFGPYFAVAWLVPSILAVGVVLMVALLAAWRVVERTMFR